jgi:hypothetical protein
VLGRVADGADDLRMQCEESSRLNLEATCRPVRVLSSSRV